MNQRGQYFHLNQQQLAIAKPGAVVQPGQTIAQIAPKNVPLVLRARMSSNESGFLKVGLPVKLKFDAYPFQDYGIVLGRLTWISPDSRVKPSSSSYSSTDNTSESNQPGEFYELEVELTQNYIQYGDRRVLLTPGQTAAAEIVIRQRRLADIFLAPFKSLKKGGIQL
jgi:HlyD family secretion protein